MKFLHVADLHLGISRYNCPERTEDFFLALYSVFEKYAVAEKVDFVLMVGDIFDVKKISPLAMNHAITCLKLLSDNSIPCIAIEGNHDASDKLNESDSNLSWLRSLSKWGNFVLLEPVFNDNGTTSLPVWDSTIKKGAYIDIGHVRIYGNTWYGSTTDMALVKILDSLRDSHDPSKFNIMMLHADIEGQLNHVKGLAVDKLRELKKYVDYMALGHIHKNFVIDDWAYSPGSLEACSVDQFDVVRGAYLVEVTGKTHKASLVRDYYQRKIIRISFELQETWTPEEVKFNIEDFLFTALKPNEKGELAPVIELTIKGRLGFKTNLLELGELKKKIQADWNPLLTIIKNNTIPADFAVGNTELKSTRADKERKVFSDLVSSDVRYNSKQSEVVDMIIEAKRLVSTDESPEQIANMLETYINAGVKRETAEEVIIKTVKKKKSKKTS